MVHFGLVPPEPAPGPLTPMQRRLREERLVRDCKACFSSNLLGRRRIARGIPVADKNCDSPLAQGTSTFFSMPRAKRIVFCAHLSICGLPYSRTWGISQSGLFCISNLKKDPSNGSRPPVSNSDRPDRVPRISAEQASQRARNRIRNLRRSSSQTYVGEKSSPVVPCMVTHFFLTEGPVGQARFYPLPFLQRPSIIRYC